MRRTPAELALSRDDLDEADVAGALACVPPHSSTDHVLLRRSRSADSPIETTRTSSPYFSPNSAMAPDCLGVLERHQARLDGRVLQHDGVGERPRPRRSLRRVIGLVCEKSKRSRSGATSEPFCATCGAEHLAQRLVQQVRRRVVGARRRAARMIDLELDGLAGLEAALLDLAEVHEQIAELLLRVGDAEQRALGAADHALVADLAAASP